MIKGKNLWIRNLFSFYNFLSPSERINSELTINIILDINHLTPDQIYVCCRMWHARAYMIPRNQNIFLWKMAGKSLCSTLSVDSSEQFSFSTIWLPSVLRSDTNWKKTFMESFLLMICWDLLPAKNCSNTSNTTEETCPSQSIEWKNCLFCTLAAILRRKTKRHYLMKKAVNL